MEKRLLRLGGATVLVASVVLSIVEFVEAVNGDNWTNPANITAHAIAMPAGWLLVVGLPALVVAMASRAALLSAIGFALFTLSVLVYEIANGPIDSVVVPYLIAHHFDYTTGHMFSGLVPVLLAGGFAKMIGSVMLGVAILRSGAFARIAAILLIAGGVVFAIALAPLPEWLDEVSAIAMLGGLAVAGWQLAGLGREREVAAIPTTATTSA